MFGLVEIRTVETDTVHMVGACEVYSRLNIYRKFIERQDFKRRIVNGETVVPRVERANLTWKNMANAILRGVEKIIRCARAK